MLVPVKFLDSLNHLYYQFDAIHDCSGYLNDLSKQSHIQIDCSSIQENPVDVFRAMHDLFYEEWFNECQSQQQILYNQNPISFEIAGHMIKGTIRNLNIYNGQMFPVGYGIKALLRAIHYLKQRYPGLIYSGYIFEERFDDYIAIEIYPEGKFTDQPTNLFHEEVANVYQKIKHALDNIEQQELKDQFWEVVKDHEMDVFLQLYDESGKTTF